MKILFKVVANTTNGIYQHNIICLAEGFKQMGLQFFGNIDYWFNEEDETYLIQSCYPSFKPDIVIYSSQFIRESFNKEPKILSNHLSVLIDSEDGYYTVSDLYANHFNFVLRSHYNSNRKYPTNVYPWAFGLSERMIKAIKTSKYSTLQERIFINYRVFYNGRYLARKFLDPILKSKFTLYNQITDPYDSEALKKEKISNLEKSYWWQTGCRHDLEYFKLLNGSRFTYSFGGPIIFKLPAIYLSRNVLKLNRKISEVLLKYKLLSSNKFLNYQFDSWRFWETMASNSIPLHFDFESWNFVLPVMPINGVHYFGVVKLNFKECGDKILSLSASDLNQISIDGTNWVLEHYSPKAVSSRLLNIVHDS
jgi:hypothetical protein